MKYIKDYSIFESLSDDQFFKTKEEIDDWIAKIFGIFNDSYINDDLIVDMDIVNIGYCKLKYFPIKFGKVRGFFCNDNNLISLKGSPVEVDSFRCENNNLTTLNYCPRIVKGNFYCHNNKLKSFGNEKINIKGSFHFQNNNIQSLKNFPTVEGNVYHNGNPISEILELVEKDKLNSFIQFLNEYDAIVDDKIILERFKDALYMIDDDGFYVKNFPIEALNYLKNYKAI